MNSSTKKRGHRFTIYLPEVLYLRFKREAKARKTTIGKIIRESLEPEERKLTGYDLVADLLGGEGSGLGDLSTNPKYLEGFGRGSKLKKSKR